VVRSVAQRIRNKFDVSVAEVADNEDRQRATIGVAVVSNDAQHCDAVLREIVDYVQSSRLDAEVVDIQTDVIPFEDA
jgi:uncharacterized protein YlxP (DUF503 family)